MDPVTQQARDLLRQRLGTIETEARSVQTALNALGNGNGKATARKRASKPVVAGKRGKQALRLIRANPGIKIPELAKKMKLKNPNYLYRVLPNLPVEKDGDGGLSVKPE